MIERVVKDVQAEKLILVYPDGTVERAEELYKKRIQDVMELSFPIIDENRLYKPYTRQV